MNSSPNRDFLLDEDQELELQDNQATTTNRSQPPLPLIERLRLRREEASAEVAGADATVTTDNNNTKSSYELELEKGKKGNILCNIKNRDILIKKVRELEDLLKTTNALNDEENNSCPICLEEITNGIVILKCAHKFCPQCYASHARVDNKCPLCRDEFADKPKKNIPMPDLVRNSIVDHLFQNTSQGETQYFKTLATSTKMKSFEDSVRNIQYLTKENCRLTANLVIKWYADNQN
tara:strand:- start:88 stop:795 length:708 start_codon:yes stop_codon:yes gene_type:complete